MTMNGSTTIVGIFGHPIKHTLSPHMHNAAFAALGLNAAYVPFAVSPRDLSEAVHAVRALNLRGVNITVPHKEQVLPFLDRIDPLAKRIGSVNTIVNDNGTLTGHNTDGRGFLKDIESQGFAPKNKTFLLVGSGGAGRAIAATLAWAGAKRIYLTDTDAARSRALSRRVPRSVCVPSTEWKALLAETDMLIHATPLGMHAGDPVLLKAQEIPSHLFVYDIIYNRVTGLLKEAKKAKAKHSGGLGMLLFQGALAVELWTKKKAPAATMRSALLKALRK